HDVHRATAARWLVSARETLAKDTQRILRARLHVTQSEIESLHRLVRSDLDVSLCRILSEDDE
ncbi:MAG: transcriptional regulator, partial [Planctomycetota bacterium]